MNLAAWAERNGVAGDSAVAMRASAELCQVVMMVVVNFPCVAVAGGIWSG
ncbi:hypothetical protein [Mycobacterium riyadhense]|nr:hypothetical protein [Mycobacterium riyadhense]